MAHPAAPKSLSDLNTFAFKEVINEDPATHSIILLGSFPPPDSSDDRVQAIVRIEKTAFDVNVAQGFFGDQGLLSRVQLEEISDIYTWLFGWLSDVRGSDVKINVICPATDVHIRKYRKQNLVMVTETPEIYEKYVKPYIQAFPPSRTQWIENILTGVSEQSKILFSSPEFLILPDMKWDLKTVSSLYLMAIVQDKSIRSLRDLRRRHLGLLNDIRREAKTAAKERWGVPEAGLRFYVHYQPSYYHFHVHIVNANYGAGLGMTVGQAHLLDDIISLLELEPEDGPGMFERMTLTYGLGEEHGIVEAIRKGPGL